MKEEIKMKNKFYFYCNINWLPGSFTIEAAVIFPIILAVIFYLIILAFSLHDTVVSKSISYRYLISYSMKIQDAYSYNDGRIYNIKNDFDLISILHQNVKFKLALNKNNLKAASSNYSIPVTFSNYNNTDLLQTYNIEKTIVNKTAD